MYNQKIIDIFAKAQNAGVLRGANGVGNATDTICGDMVRIYLNIENEQIVEAKFKAFGCVATIASASVLTDLVLGKTIEQSQHLTDHDICTILGDLPIDKHYCAILGIEALNNALLNYYKSIEKEQN